ncbi:MAG: alginate lyase family protein [Burkholderiaceae bacterium]|nr:alginate lyase family protein [Burkholderiaceae bacterium]
MDIRAAVAVLAVCSLGIFAAPSRAAEACPDIAPLLTLELKDTYKDPKFSVQNEDNEAANAAALQALTRFFQTLNVAVDSPDAHPGNAQSDCAFQLFNRWASAGALTIEPKVYNSGGKVTRGLRNPAFQILALKLRAAGYTLDGTALRWLQKMDRDNVTFYAKGPNRGNQRVWAAAGAALNNLVASDAEALAFQDQVWHEAIAAIHDNGLIDAELTRGQMALAYHMYSLSALLILERARDALGYAETAEEKHKVKLLEDGIGRALCSPEEMEHLAGAKMRPVGNWGYEVINGFARAEGSLGADWDKCALPATDFDARDYGGDARRSAQVLDALAARHKNLK